MRLKRQALTLAGARSLGHLPEQTRLQYGRQPGGQRVPHLAVHVETPSTVSFEIRVDDERLLMV